MTRKQERFPPEAFRRICLRKSAATRLDVHWRFLPASIFGGGLDPEEALARRVPVQILGKTVYFLHPEDNLLMLCQHGSTNHFWHTLSMVSDVAQLIHSRKTWNWPRVFQRAKDSGLHCQALLGLSLARELLGAPVPPELMEEAEANPSVVAVRRWVVQNFWVRNQENLGFSRKTLFLSAGSGFFQRPGPLRVGPAGHSHIAGLALGLPSRFFIFAILRHPSLAAGPKCSSHAGLELFKKIDAGCALLIQSGIPRQFLVIKSLFYLRSKTSGENQRQR